MLVHKNLTYLSKEEVTDGVVSISKFLETKSPSRPANSKFDWDKSAICLMYTTRNGQSRVVKHTNKSITAQVFSPKGTSNHWFDQVFINVKGVKSYLKFTDNRRLYPLWELVLSLHWVPQFFPLCYPWPHNVFPL